MNMTVQGGRIVAAIRSAIVLSVFLMFPIAGLAYEETSVSNGGTVTGTVQFSGEVPQPTPFELRRYPDQVYCGALSDGSGYRLLREVSVGPQQGLKDVVVTIEILPSDGRYLVTAGIFYADDARQLDTITAMLDLRTKREAFGEVKPFFAPANEKKRGF